MIQKHRRNGGLNLWCLCHEALAKWYAQQDSLDTVGICGEAVTILVRYHFQNLLVFEPANNIIVGD